MNDQEFMKDIERLDNIRETITAFYPDIDPYVADDAADMFESFLRDRSGLISWMIFRDDHCRNEFWKYFRERKSL